jgi:hypothetical protein
MRKKLRSRIGETSSFAAEHPGYEARQPGAQDVARCSASSCAYSGAIDVKIFSSNKKTTQHIDLYGFNTLWHEL